MSLVSWNDKKRESDCQPWNRKKNLSNGLLFYKVSKESPICSKKIKRDFVFILFCFFLPKKSFSVNLECTFFAPCYLPLHETSHDPTMIESSGNTLLTHPARCFWTWLTKKFQQFPQQFICFEAVIDNGFLNGNIFISNSDSRTLPRAEALPLAGILLFWAWFYTHFNAKKGFANLHLTTEDSFPEVSPSGSLQLTARSKWAWCYVNLTKKTFFFSSKYAYGGHGSYILLSKQARGSTNCLCSFYVLLILFTLFSEFCLGRFPRKKAERGKKWSSLVASGTEWHDENLEVWAWLCRRLPHTQGYIGLGDLILGWSCMENCKQVCTSP